MKNTDLAITCLFLEHMFHDLRQSSARRNWVEIAYITNTYVDHSKFNEYLYNKDMYMYGTIRFCFVAILIVCHRGL